MTARLALAAVLLALASAPPAAADAPPTRAAPVEVLTAHYVLTSEGPRAEAEEWGRVLEAAWPRLAEFFGAAPDLERGRRLSVAFCESAERFREAIRAAGGSPPEGGDVGGYYDPVSRGVFLWRQPTRWFTRTLLLHEAVHQFHFLARTGNRAPGAAWWVEGVAEHLSHHTWDGTTLEIGIVPPISLEDYGARALAAATADGFRLEALVDRGAGAPRPESMHLVRWLATEPAHRKRFAAYARRLDAGASLDAGDFARAFGGLRSLQRDWTAWLRSAPAPFVYGHVEWDALAPGAVRGTSPVVAVCRSRAPLSRLEAEVRPPTGGGRVGLLLQWSDLQAFTALRIDGAGTAVVDERRDGGWRRRATVTVPLPAAGRPWRLVARRQGGTVAVDVDGREALSVDVPPGPLGLAVDATTADFTSIR